ncbi:Autophagy-related protein 13 [Choanephora cucurbitarum]|uniref:Autophagy-related protein 13 n=1 Tax=Choanephora cucurbitarum TaxID=101091 RepID=A0A1C7NAQ1_9FUNG|nr:Autophagy-related protein 13 [Choanephora cucurbitarum]
MQSPNQPPTSTSTSTRNSKLDQIIQNFYTKTVQIIIQGRCTPHHDIRYGKRASLKGSSSSRKINKWFNIATEDVEILREELKYWKTMSVQPETEPPSMVLDIYLDTSKLSYHQSLMVADDNLRWGRIELNRAEHIDRILIESWELSLKHPLPDFAVDLPNLYKRSIVFFRSLHSLSRLLPGHDLYRQISGSKDTPLSIGYRLSSSLSKVYPEEIALNSTILENDARKPTKNYSFSDIVTPIGTFKLNVSYRRNCDFRVEDTERDLSAQFIDMDEKFFTPTMTKYHQQQQKLSVTINPKRSSLDTKMDLTPSTSTSSRHILEHRSSLGRQSESPTNRRSSAPFVVSPFKSPFLSSSPQAESIFSGAGSGGSTTATIAAQRQYGTSPTSSERSRPLDSGSYSRKIEFSSSFDKYKSPSPSRESPSNASMMMRRWSRASDLSSVNFKQEEEDTHLEDFVRLVGSNQDLRMFSKTNSDLLSSTSDSDTSSMMKLSHFQSLRETHNTLSESLSSSMILQPQSQNPETSTVSPVSSTSSTGRSYQPAVPSPLHAGKRSTSPVHIPRSYPQLMSMTTTSKTTTASTTQSKSHTTDLSAYSTYPQDFHHQRPLSKHKPVTFSMNTSKVAERRLITQPQAESSGQGHTVHAVPFVGRRQAGEENQATGEKDEEERMQKQQEPMKTHKQTSLEEIEKNVGEGSSEFYNRSEGSSTLLQDVHSSHRVSLLDDDDSLVFKMSELECEGPPRASTTPPNKQHEMFFNNRNKAFIKSASTSTSPTRHDPRPDTTLTPLSPPLLQRLQSISSQAEMKDNKDESKEEKEEPLSKPTMPFDAW